MHTKLDPYFRIEQRGCVPFPKGQDRFVLQVQQKQKELQVRWPSLENLQEWECVPLSTPVQLHHEVSLLPSQQGLWWQVKA